MKMPATTQQAQQILDALFNSLKTWPEEINVRSINGYTMGDYMTELQIFIMKNA